VGCGNLIHGLNFQVFPIFLKVNSLTIQVHSWLLSFSAQFATLFYQPMTSNAFYLASQEKEPSQELSDLINYLSRLLLFS